MDVVHLHGIYPLGKYLTKYKKHIGYKLVLTPHGADIQKIPEIGYGDRLDPFVENEIKGILSEADAVTAISPIIARDIRSLVSKEPTLIPNGISVDGFRSRDSHEIRRKIRSTLGLEENSRILLAVGRNHKKKGFDVLIRAMSLVASKVPNTYLVIVGPGCESLKPLMRSLNLNGRVFLPGRVPKKSQFDPMDFQSPVPELVEYYLACDVFVLPSYIESFGIVTLEAMAAGKPLVLTRLDGNRDASGVAADGDNAFLVEPGDWRQMAAKLVELLQSEQLCEQMGARSLQLIADYDWPKVACRYIRLYEELTNSAK